MTMPQLIRTAKDEERRDEYTGLKKQDLIFKILKERVKQNGLMFGEGTLEVLPDGFGFLRSPDYNYLPCPDDIYISPQPDPPLRPADRRGRRRPDPPAEGERALLRPAARRGDQLRGPRPADEKVVFDDLTPLHPNERLKLETDADEINMRVDRHGHADRQGPARPDRRPAADRQDDPAPEDRQQHPHEPPRVLRHRPADRRAARGSDRHGADRSRGRRAEVISSTFDEPASAAHPGQPRWSSRRPSGWSSTAATW